MSRDFRNNMKQQNETNGELQILYNVEESCNSLELSRPVGFTIIVVHNLQIEFWTMRKDHAWQCVTECYSNAIPSPEAFLAGPQLEASLARFRHPCVRGPRTLRELDERLHFAKLVHAKSINKSTDSTVGLRDLCDLCAQMRECSGGMNVILPTNLNDLNLRNSISLFHLNRRPSEWGKGTC